MRRLVLPATLALALIPLAGCIASLAPAEIPLAALPQDWEPDPDASQRGSAGAGPVTVDFEVKGYEKAGAPQGKIVVATVPDVPLYDEGAKIREEIDKQLAANGVSESFRSEGTTTIGGDEATYRLYAIQKTEGGRAVDGQSIYLTWTCKATGNVVGVYGWALTERHTPLGESSDESTWQDVVGKSAPATIGGLVAAVDCSP